MKWDSGFSARYTMTIVDPDSWRDSELVDVVSGSIDRSTEDLLESATLELKESIGESWIRIYLDARQEGESSERVPLFTGLTSSPERSINGTRVTYSVDCYSTLKPASDILLQRGWYAPSGMNGAQLAYNLLNLGAPVDFEEDSPVLSDAIVAEDGETNLTMAHKIVNAIGWEISISGDGSIHIGRKQTEEVAQFDALSYDVIELDVTDTEDWFSCPNVFRAVNGDTVAVARDDDPDSPLSTISRGREIWMEESDVDLNDGESLTEYAIRRLKEEQSPSRTLSYNRRFDPNVKVGSVVRIKYPDIEGQFRVNSQSITLGFGARTQEEVSYVIGT